MDAALVTGMLSARFNANTQPAKKVVEKQGTGKFEDVLTDKMDSKTRDVKKTEGKERKEVEKKDTIRKDTKEDVIKEDDIKEKDVKDENVDNKEVENIDDEKTDVEDKDDKKEDKNKIKELREKLNILIENILKDGKNTGDVENTEDIKEKINEIVKEVGIDLSEEDVTKISDRIKEKILEKVDNVGPQSVETENTKLNKNEKNKEGKDLIENPGSKFVSKKSENEAESTDETVTSVLEGEQTEFEVTSEFENKGSLEAKTGKNKENKFNITDLRRKDVSENKVDQLDLDVKEINNENLEIEDSSATTILDRADDLQKQIDIIKQVSEQVDVTLLEDKSEMVIKLKPDHLGKITMQLSVENGNVVAKFLAESDKVKQALESNFQDLKDNLAKQGLVVQDMSVSVGNENKGNAFDNGNYKSFGRKITKIDNISRNPYGMGIASYGRNDVDVKRYWPNSTISFSA